MLLVIASPYLTKSKKEADSKEAASHLQFVVQSPN